MNVTMFQVNCRLQHNMSNNLMLANFLSLALYRRFIIVNLSLVVHAESLRLERK